MTAAELAKKSFFIQACERLGVEPTKRQARKARNRQAYWKDHPLFKQHDTAGTPKPKKYKGMTRAA